MTDNLKLLIVEDPRDLSRLSKNILEEKGFDVTTCPKDGKVLLRMIEEQKPDAVVMEMFMANFDAIAVTKAVRENHTSKKPIIVVTSNYDNGNIELGVMESGASYFLLKPFDYDLLADRIRSMCGFGTYIVRNNEKKQMSDIDLEMLVTDILHQVGVPAHIKGYHYLRTSIMLSVRNREMINHITKELYPTVAKQYKTTSTRVERSIRHAIESAWDRGDVDVLNSYFGYTIHNQKGKPTNSEFVAMISDKICLKIKASKLA